MPEVQPNNDLTKSALKSFLLLSNNSSQELTDQQIIEGVPELSEINSKFGVAPQQAISSLRSFGTQLKSDPSKAGELVNQFMSTNGAAFLPQQKVQQPTGTQIQPSGNQSQIVQPEQVQPESPGKTITREFLTQRINNPNETTKDEIATGLTQKYGSVANLDEAVNQLHQLQFDIRNSTDPGALAKEFAQNFDNVLLSKKKESVSGSITPPSGAVAPSTESISLPEFKPPVTPKGSINPALDPDRFGFTFRSNVFGQSEANRIMRQNVLAEMQDKKDQEQYARSLEGRIKDAFIKTAAEDFNIPEEWVRENLPALALQHQISDPDNTNAFVLDPEKVFTKAGVWNAAQQREALSFQEYRNKLAQQHLTNIGKQEKQDYFERILNATGGNEEKAQQEFAQSMDERAMNFLSPTDLKIRDIKQDIYELRNKPNRTPKDELALREKQAQLHQFLMSGDVGGRDLYDPQTGNFVSGNEASQEVVEFNNKVKQLTAQYQNTDVGKLRKLRDDLWFQIEAFGNDVLPNQMADYEPLEDVRRKLPSFKNYDPLIPMTSEQKREFALYMFGRGSYTLNLGSAPEKGSTDALKMINSGVWGSEKTKIPNEILANYLAVNRMITLNEDPGYAKEAGFFGNIGAGLKEAIGGTPTNTSDLADRSIKQIEGLGYSITDAQKDQLDKTITQQVGRAIGNSLPISAEIGANLLLINKAKGVLGIPKLAQTLAGGNKIAQFGLNLAYDMASQGAAFSMAGEGFAGGVGEGFGQAVAGTLLNRLGLRNVFLNYGVRAGLGATTETAAEFSGQFLTELEKNGGDWQKAADNTFGKTTDEFWRKAAVTYFTALSMGASTAGQKSNLFLEEVQKELKESGSNDPAVVAAINFDVTIPPTSEEIKKSQQINEKIKSGEQLTEEDVIHTQLMAGKEQFQANELKKSEVAPVIFKKEGGDTSYKFASPTKKILQKGEKEESGFMSEAELTQKLDDPEFIQSIKSGKVLLQTQNPSSEIEQKIMEIFPENQNEQNDNKNIQGVPGEERIGQKSVEAESIQKAGGQEVTAGGILQAQKEVEPKEVELKPTEGKSVRVVSITDETGKPTEDAKSQILLIKPTSREQAIMQSLVAGEEVSQKNLTQKHPELFDQVSEEEVQKAKNRISETFGDDTGAMANNLVRGNSVRNLMFYNETDKTDFEAKIKERHDFEQEIFALNDDFTSSKELDALMAEDVEERVKEHDQIVNNGSEQEIDEIFSLIPGGKEGTATESGSKSKSNIKPSKATYRRGEARQWEAGDKVKLESGVEVVINRVVDFDPSTEITTISYGPPGRQNRGFLKPVKNGQNLGGGVKLNIPEKTLEKETVSLIPIDEIENVRTQEEDFSQSEEIQKSFKENGVTDPLKITYYPEKKVAVLTDGHHRLDTAKKNGITDLPVIITESIEPAPDNAKEFELPASGLKINKETKNETKRTTKESRASQNSKSDAQKRRAERRKVLASDKRKEVLNSLPTTIREAVLHYFIGGGKIHSSVIQKIFGGGGKKISRQFRSMLSLVDNKKGLTLDGIAHALWERQNGNEFDFAEDVYTDQDFRNEIEDVLLSHTGTKSMLEEYTSQTDAEAKYYERLYAQEVEEEAEYHLMAEEHLDYLSDEEIDQWLNDSQQAEADLIKETASETEIIPTAEVKAESEVKPKTEKDEKAQTENKTETEAKAEILKKDLAEKIVEALLNSKFKPRGLDRFGSDPRPIFEAAWNTAVETAILAVKGGATIAKAVESGLKAIKNTDWYKNIAEEKKSEADNVIKDNLSEMIEQEHKNVSEGKEPDPSKEEVVENAGKVKLNPKNKRVAERIAKQSDLKQETKDRILETASNTVRNQEKLYSDSKVIFDEVMSETGGNYEQVIRLADNSEINPDMREMLYGHAMQHLSELEQSSDPNISKAASNRLVELGGIIAERLNAAGKQIKSMHTVYLKFPMYVLYSSVSRIETFANRENKRKGDPGDVKKSIGEDLNSVIRDVMENFDELLKDPKFAKEIERLKRKITGRKRPSGLTDERKAELKKKREAIKRRFFGQTGKLQAGIPFADQVIAIVEYAATLIEEGFYRSQDIIQVIKDDFGDINVNLTETQIKDALVGLKEFNDILEGEKISSKKDTFGQTVSRAVEKYLKEGLKNANITMKQAVIASDKSKEKIKADLISQLKTEFDLTDQEAEVVVKVVDQIFREKAGQMLTRRMNDIYPKVSVKKSVRKSAIEKLVDDASLGAFDVSVGFFDEMMKAHGMINTNDPIKIQKLRDLANKVRNAPVGSLKDKANKDLQTFIHQETNGYGFMDWIMTRFYGSILSGPMTHIRNLDYNTIAVGVLGPLSQIYTQGANPFYTWKEMLKSFYNVDRKVAAHYVKTGDNFIDPGLSPKSYADQLQFNLIKNGITKLLNLTSTRFLIASDMIVTRPYAAGVFKNYVKAWINTERGLKGRELERAAMEEMGYTQENVDKSSAEALQDIKNFYGFDPFEDGMSDAVKKEASVLLLLRTQERILENSGIQERMGTDNWLDKWTGESLQESTMAEAKNLALQGEVVGAVGVFSEALNKLIEKAPFLKFKVPFVNILGNMMNMAIKWTPGVGQLQALLRYSINHKLAEKGMPTVSSTTAFLAEKIGAVKKGALEPFTKEYSQRQASRDLKHALFVTGIHALIYSLMAKDEDDEGLVITGMLSDAFFERQDITKGTGMNPFSVYWRNSDGSHTFLSEYKNSAFGYPLAFFGAAADGVMNGEMSTKAYLKALYSSPWYIADKPAATALKEVWESLSPTDKYGNNKWLDPNTSFKDASEVAIAGFMNSAFVPNLFKQSNKIAEQVYGAESKRATDWWQSLIKGVPFANQTALETQVDHFGRVIEQKFELGFLGIQGNAKKGFTFLEPTEIDPYYKIYTDRGKTPSWYTQKQAPLYEKNEFGVWAPVMTGEEGEREVKQMISLSKNEANTINMLIGQERKKLIDQQPYYDFNTGETIIGVKAFDKMDNVTFDKVSAKIEEYAKKLAFAEFFENYRTEEIEPVETKKRRVFPVLE